MAFLGSRRALLSSSAGNAPALQWDATKVSALPPWLSFTRASTATYFDGNGNLATAVSNVARFDNAPGVANSPRGLLIEEARTNSALWSRDMTNAAWVKTNVTAAQTATGIDGAANSATTLTATLAAGTVLQTITLGSSADTYSVYIRRSTGSGTVSISVNGAAWTAVTLTASFQRFQLTSTLANPIIGIQFATSGDAVDVDGNQLEVGGFATSLIPTTTVAVARAQDFPVGTTASAGIVAGGGTIAVRYRPMFVPQNANAMIFEGLGNSGVTINFDSSGTAARLNSRASVTPLDFNFGAPTLLATATTQSMVSYGPQTPVASVNGVSQTSPTGIVTTAWSSTFTLGNRAGSLNFNGWIQGFAAYKSQLSQAQMNAMSAGLRF